MKKALSLTITLLAFLAAPPSGLAREPVVGTKPTATAKSLSRGKAQASTGAKKNKKAVRAKRKTGVQARKVSHAATRPKSLQELMGPPYSGGELNLRSASVLVVNQGTGEPLYAKNPELEAPIASITKLMTAMVTLDAGLPLHEEITISAEDVDRLKGTRSRLRLGATLTREELLHLALIASENRAAAALSRAYPGGREAFVEAMNRKAAQLGMQHTRFVDGTGLSNFNRSTAADLVKLVDAAYRYPLIRKISTTGSYKLTMPASKRVHHLAFNNTNLLTRKKDWEIGVSKTGYINEAGHCLVMQARIAEQKVIIVLLDSWGKLSRIGDANRIRQWLEHTTTGRMASRNGKTSV
ncbi:MAG: D-alanyl-D-alanine endopeptidase [Thiobacillaceae bacterium]